MPSKEKDDAVDRSELDLNKSDNGKKDNEFRDLCSPGESGGVPWEKRYEKLWVEVEKREVKSTFKSVAGELKEKFGELFKSRHDITEEQVTAGSASAEEDSSDEEDGEVIERPTARAKSTALLTIPEQRESGPEDSAAESNANSLCEDRMQEQPACDGTVTSRADLSQTEENTASSEDDPNEFAICQPPFRSSAPVPGVSDEELEEDMESFKLEVGMLKVVFLDMEKEKAQLQKEVEDGRPIDSSFLASLSLFLMSFMYFISFFYSPVSKGSKWPFIIGVCACVFGGAVKW